MKYQKRVHWDRHRPEFLKLGFIFALAIAFMAFNYTSEPPIYEPFEIGDIGMEDEIIPPVTVHKKKTVPPPPPPPKKIRVIDIEPVSEPQIEFKQEVEVEPKENGVEDEFANDLVFEDPPIVEIIKAEEPEDEGPVLFADRMPIYGDCGLDLDEIERRNCTTNNLIEYAYRSVRYPDMARDAGVQGTVVVSFVVDKKGDVKDIEILRDIGFGCGAEVKKAILKLGNFLPGKQNGRPVSVIYRLPVKFKLQG